MLYKINRSIGILCIWLATIHMPSLTSSTTITTTTAIPQEAIEAPFSDTLEENSPNTYMPKLTQITKQAIKGLCQQFCVSRVL